MKTFTFMMGQSPARWLFLFGVLAGLFFSSGEGIQLLPFPFAEGKDSNLAVSVPAENAKSYAFSVFSSRSYYSQLKSKFQKDPNPYLSGKDLNFEHRAARAGSGRRAARDLQKSRLFHSSLVPDSTADRAPPRI